MAFGGGGDEDDNRGSDLEVKTIIRVKKSGMTLYGGRGILFNAIHVVRGHQN